MLILISPAKKLDFATAPISDRFTQCEFLADAQQLIDTLKPLGQGEIAKLMHLSDNLAKLNVERYQHWSQPFTPQNAKAAILAFKGDVYAGMNADTFTEANLDFAQRHLRILSGLYGLLRPLDLMQPYRLEMGTRLDNPRGKNLYEFWGEKITQAVNQAALAAGGTGIINLASAEYFKSVKPRQLQVPLITPQFKECKNGEYKIIGIYAKRARGLMSRYIIDNELTAAEALKTFTWEGYAYNEALSSEAEWVFTR